jgi:hypothetical protein
MAKKRMIWKSIKDKRSNNFKLKYTKILKFLLKIWEFYSKLHKLKINQHLKASNKVHNFFCLELNKLILLSINKNNKGIYHKLPYPQINKYKIIINKYHCFTEDFMDLRMSEILATWTQWSSF